MIIDQIPFLANNQNIFLQLAAVIILFTVSLALRMSLYRLAFAEKGKKPTPKEQRHIDNFSEGQLLASEWAPIGIGLCVLLHLKFFVNKQNGGDSAFYQEVAILSMVTWCVCRLGFQCKYLVGAPFVLSALSMTILYIATFVAGGIVIFV